MPTGEHLKGPRKYGGRKKGTPNRVTMEFNERLAYMGCCPEEIMALIAINQLPCGVCRGKLRTPYSIPNMGHRDGCSQPKQDPRLECKECKNTGERQCQSCHGSGLETCDPKLRGQMSAELMCYRLPKRKAIEHSGPDGGDIGVRLVVEYVKDPLK